MSCTHDCNQGRTCTCGDGVEDIGWIAFGVLVAVAVSIVALVLVDFVFRILP